MAAFLMLIFMFSLTGIPPTAGFIGKFYIFKSAVEANLIWLAVAGVIFSSISAYFYLRVIMVMYMHDPKGEFSSRQRRRLPSRWPSPWPPCSTSASFPRTS